MRALEEAFEKVRRDLFPFRFHVWVTLGFAAFLDQCGRGGGSSIPSPPEVGDARRFPDVGGATEWAVANWLLIGGLVVAGLLCALAFVALVLWISSRGTFVYLDDVAFSRAEIVRPWNAHARAADDYFRWWLGLTVATVALVGSILGMAGLVVYAITRGGARPMLAVALVVVFALLAVFVVALAASLASLALRDFVAPLQMARGIPCGEAVRLVADLVQAHVGVFLVYLLLKLVFTVALALAMVLAGCLTCCLGFLPVVSQTLLQPAFYLERAWSLCLLRQLGHPLGQEAP